MPILQILSLEPALLTPAGRKQLAVEKDSWARLSVAVKLIFEEGSR